MNLLFSYLRKSWKSVLLIIILLSAQVVSNLALPYYTSIIVNVGIQQGGIETPVPDYLPPAEYEDLVSTHGTLIEKSYTLDGETYSLTSAPDEELVRLFTSRYSESRSTEAAAQRLSAIEGVKNLYRTAGIDLPSLQTGYILSKGLAMIIITLLGAAASIGVSYIASSVAAETGRSLRERIFNTVLTFHQKETDAFGTPTLITRSTNDVTQIQNSLIMILRVTFLAPLMAVGGIIQVFATGTPLTWTIALAVAILISTVILMFRLVMPRFRRQQVLIDKINGILRETLKGILVIRSFSKQKSEIARFEETNEETTRISLFVNRTMAAMHPIMMLIMNLTGILIVYAGSSLVLRQEMQVGDIMAFIQYAMMIIMSFLMISMLSIMLPRAAISAQRVEEVLSTKPSITDGTSHLPPVKKAGREITFDHVSFTFPGADTPALEDITCTFAAGTVTGIIGSTGAGKSTLLNLIPRFIEPQKGSITIDGRDISSLNLHSLREAVGLVPQSTYLFSGPAADNISFPAQQADEKAVQDAADSAGASTFIEKREGGYQSIITSGGTNLSGGQRQRVAIARALYSHSPLLIFDDSFSAVDSRTEREIREKLRQNHTGTTMIIVSQKVSTIRDSHSIIVLDEGRIVSQGTHEELLKSCPVYQEIARSQSSRKEAVS